jgi:hypothetical protein
MDRTLTPNKLTMQQYNSRVAIMVQKENPTDEVTRVVLWILVL